MYDRGIIALWDGDIAASLSVSPCKLSYPTSVSGLSSQTKRRLTASPGLMDTLSLALVPILWGHGNHLVVTANSLHPQQSPVAQIKHNEWWHLKEQLHEFIYINGTSIWRSLGSNLWPRGLTDAPLHHSDKASHTTVLHLASKDYSSNEAPPASMKAHPEIIQAPSAWWYARSLIMPAIICHTEPSSSSNLRSWPTSSHINMRRGHPASPTPTFDHTRETRGGSQSWSFVTELLSSTSLCSPFISSLGVYTSLSCLFSKTEKKKKS